MADAKGYWMVRVTVKDPERYKDYVAANRAPNSWCAAAPMRWSRAPRATAM